MGNIQSSILSAVGKQSKGSDTCPALETRIKELESLTKRTLTDDDQDRIKILKQEVDRIVYLLDQEKKGSLDKEGKEELDALNNEAKQKMNDSVKFQIHNSEMMAREVSDNKTFRPMAAMLRPVDDKGKKGGVDKLQYDMGF
jgi:uncharacterized protein YnzC (UPF0291/DUF896 family)